MAGSPVVHYTTDFPGRYVLRTLLLSIEERSQVQLALKDPHGVERSVNFRIVYFENTPEGRFFIGTTDEDQTINVSFSNDGADVAFVLPS